MLERWPVDTSTGCSEFPAPRAQLCGLPGITSLYGANGLATDLALRAMRKGPLRKEYATRAAPHVERVLVAVGIVLGASALVLGAVNYVSPSDVPTLPTILAIWMIALAVFMPVDVAGTIEQRRRAVRLGTSSVAVFVLIYPAYMFNRPMTRKSRGYWALLSVLAFMVGLVL